MPSTAQCDSDFQERHTKALGGKDTRRTRSTQVLQHSGTSAVGSASGCRCSRSANAGSAAGAAIATESPEEATASRGY